MADEAKKYTFLVNDDSVINSYGFRVMTKGINLVQYKKNPLVVWFHKRERRYGDANDPSTVILPIGKSVKLWKDDGKLYADIVFDMEDEFAAKIAGKVEREFLRMCSPGLNPIDISDDAKNLLAGQQRPTLMKSSLEEISIVDVGSNPNALRLSKDQTMDDVMPLLNLSKNNTTNDMDFQKEVAAKLGLDPNADPTAVLAAMDAKITLAKEADVFKTKFEGLQKTFDEAEEKRIIALVSANVDKRFTADKKDSLIALGKKSGYAALNEVIEMMPTAQKPTDSIVPGVTPKGDPEMTFAKLKEQGMEALELYKKEKRDSYIALYKSEYGVEPKFEED